MLFNPTIHRTSDTFLNSHISDRFVSPPLKPYSDEKEYFEYAGTVVKQYEKLYRASTTKTDAGKALMRLSSLDEYAPKRVKDELINLEKGKSSTHPTLRFIPAPARLEFLAAMAIHQAFKNVVVTPNYPCDDEGLPLTTASGDKGDIECIEGHRGVLVEVTLACGRTQTIMECWPISRHLDTFAKKSEDPNAEALFVAPTIYDDTLKQFSWLKATEEQSIRSYKISDFISFLTDARFLSSH